MPEAPPRTSASVRVAKVGPPVLVVRILTPSPVAPDTVPVAESETLPAPVVRVRLTPVALPETSPSDSVAVPPWTWVIRMPSPRLPVALPETATVGLPFAWFSRMP